MRTDSHIWRTTDGRHVPHGHRDAAVLAYAAGDDVPDAVLDELTGTKHEPRPKARRKPADKARRPQADKSATPGEELDAAVGVESSDDG